LTPGEWSPARDLTLVGVRLRPGVLFALTRIPASNLAGRRERLARWCAADATSLETRPAGAGLRQENFDLRECCVRPRPRGAAVAQRIVRAVALLSGDEGRTTIAELAHRCRTSARHLDRLFRRWVGLNPKTFARIMRFQASLASLDPVAPPALADIANGLGFF